MMIPMMMAMGHLLATPVALGHELESDRLTVVQRAPMHIALVFRVDEIAVLQRSLAPMLAPTTGRAEFLLSMTAMSEAEFVRVVDEARSRFAAAMIVHDQDDKALELQNWRWSSHQELRRRMRELALGSIVGGDATDHGHEMSVDAIATAPVVSVKLILPEAAGDLLIVSYRPIQRRHQFREKTPLEIRF